MARRRAASTSRARSRCAPATTGRRARSARSAVEAVREEWLVEDRWWTPRPLRRHYFELALADGRAVTVFRDADDGRWFRQRA